MKNLLFVLFVAFCSSLAAAPAAPRIKDIRISQFDGLNWKDVIIHPTNGMLISFDANRAPKIGGLDTASTNVFQNDLYLSGVSNALSYSIIYLGGSHTIALRNAGTSLAFFDELTQNTLATFQNTAIDLKVAGYSAVEISSSIKNDLPVTNTTVVDIAGLTTAYGGLTAQGRVTLSPSNNLVTLSANTSITNAAGPAIYFGSTNLPTFTAPAGSLYLAGGGGFYVRTNNAWLGK